MTRFWITLGFIVLLAQSLTAATISGTLFDAQGATLGEVSLVFLASSPSEPVEITAFTDSRGHFETDLPSGEYEVFLVREQGRIFLRRLLVESDEAGEVELRLSQDQESSLAAIRDYELGVQEGSTVGSKPLTDLINPFPAKRQGSYYGSLYEFHRNDNFDARNFFDPVGEPLPEYKRNQFGFTFGTTLRRNLTLFGSYDGLRIVQGSTILSHVPTAALKAGDFSALENPPIDPLTGDPFPGGVIPQDRISPISRKLLSVLPDPNRNDPDRNFVNNDPRVINRNYLNLRAEYDLKENSKLQVDYHYTGENQTRPRSLPSFSSHRQERHQSMSASYNRAFWDGFIGYARIEFNRNRSFELADNSGNAGLLNSLGIKGLEGVDPIEEGYPNFNMTSYVDFGDQNSPNTGIRNRLEMDTSVTYVHRNHRIRGGIEIEGRQLNNYRSDGLHRGSFSFSGNFSGDAFADLLLGYPDTAYRGIGADRADLRRKRWSLFLRDDWKVTSRFDVSYGVRYAYAQPYHSITNNVSGFVPLLFEPPTTGEIILAGSPEASQLGFDDAVSGSLIFPDRNDWSPNLGFAYNPLGTNQMVVRASYSIWYDSPNQWYFLESLTRNYPYYYIESVDSPPDSPGITFSDPFRSASVPELTIRGISPHIRNGYVHYWRLDVQNQVGRNWNLEVSYIGRKGSSVTRRIPGNVPLPGEGPLQDRRPNPEFGKFYIVDDGGSYAGHALDLTAERRLSNGLSFRSGFEWNRFMDDNVSLNPSNPRNLAAERASASWVPRKRFFLNYIVELPITTIGPLAGADGWVQTALGGWRLSGITEIQDGRPFTVFISGDPNNDGVYGDRPDRIADGRLDSSEQSIDRWFDTSAFVAPEPYGFGNAGRNILLGPGHQAWDISVVKRTSISDGDTLEFRIEFFNAFNNVNFHRPDANFESDQFGKIFGADRAREIELALKYSF